MQEQAADQCYCLPVVPCAPPRLRKINKCGVIEITPATVKTWVTLERGLCERMQVLPNELCIAIEIYRKGCEERLATYNAFSRDVNGAVSFYWDCDFLDQPTGFYYGDVFLNDHYCFTLPFRIPRCDVRAVNCYSEYEKDCADSCGDTIGGSGVASGCVEPSCIPLEVIDKLKPNAPACNELPAVPCPPGAACDGGIGSSVVGFTLVGVDDEESRMY